MGLLILSSDFLIYMVQKSGFGLILIGIIALVASWLVWQTLLRNRMLYNSKSEPPMLPYWIPGIGHSWAFFNDTHKTLVQARNYFSQNVQPFSVLIGGRRTYIVMDPKHIIETYKKTEELSFDMFIDQTMGLVGVSDQARKIMWSTIVASKKMSVPSSIRQWARDDLQKGPASEPFYAHCLKNLDNLLRADMNPNLVTSKSTLLKWTGDIIVTASTNAMFGTVCLGNAHELLQAFQDFNHNAWMLLFQYPKMFSMVAENAKDTSVNSLTKYFDLPQDKRPGAAEFIIRSEDEMRKNGIGSRDIASVLFKLYWAINGNPSILAFWLLAHILYQPALLATIKAEIIPAFLENGIQSQPDLSILLDHCPNLNALFYETMRIHGGASTFRRVVTDTTIAGFDFKTGCDVMMPYRQLHMNEGYWGADAEIFDTQKFVDNPRLASKRTFKPFGGGSTFCPGRFLAQHTAITFIATLLVRFDIEVVGGPGSQKFPSMADTVPTLGIISPVPGDDIKITVKAVIV